MLNYPVIPAKPQRPLTAKERVQNRNSQLKYCSEFNLKMMEEKLKKQMGKYKAPDKKMMKSTYSLLFTE